MLASSLLLSLALLPDVEAANVPKIKNIRIRDTDASGAGTYKIGLIATHDDAVADVAAEVDGVAYTLEAGDGWLHASGYDASYEDAMRLEVAAYDATGAALASFTGTRTGDTLAFVRSGGEDGQDCTARAGCEGTGTRDGADLDLLAGSVFAGTLGLDLVGADALLVSYVTVSADGGAPSALATDELGVLWSAELAAFDGVADATVVARDASGGTLDTLVTELVTPWDDGAGGVSALPTDEDPLTSVAIDRWQAVDATPQDALIIVSDGWYADDPLPTYAEVTLAGGEEWIVPVNSYQVAGIARLAPAAEPRTACSLDSDGHVVGGETLADGTVVLSVTAYGTDAAALPTSEALTFTCTNRTGVPTSEEATVAYDAEVAVVFGYTFELAEAPHGLELSGRVRLRGRQTLLVGRFAGQLGVDDDGDLGLAAIDRGALAPRGDILIGGEPIDFELVRDDNGDGVINGPPAVVLKTDSNGSGTRKVTTTTNGKPGLL